MFSSYQNAKLKSISRLLVTHIINDSLVLRAGTSVFIVNVLYKPFTNAKVMWIYLIFCNMGFNLAPHLSLRKRACFTKS